MILIGFTWWWSIRWGSDCAWLNIAFNPSLRHLTDNLKQIIPANVIGLDRRGNIAPG